jgi:hypothetical protein
MGSFDHCIVCRPIRADLTILQTIIYRFDHRVDIYGLAGPLRRPFWARRAIACIQTIVGSFDNSVDKNMPV